MAIGQWDGAVADRDRRQEAAEPWAAAEAVCYEVIDVDGTRLGTNRPTADTAHHCAPPGHSAGHSGELHEPHARLGREHPVPHHFHRRRRDDVHLIILLVVALLAEVYRSRVHVKQGSVYGNPDTAQLLAELGGLVRIGNQLVGESKLSDLKPVESCHSLRVGSSSDRARGFTAG